MLMVAAWSGPAMAVIFLLGWVVAAHFIPPTAPADSAEQIRAFYMNNLTGIRIGMILCAIGAVLLVPFGAVVAVLLRRTEGGLPVLTYTQLVCSAMSTVFIVLTATAYGVAAFRADEAPAFVTVGFNDLGSFFAAVWTPFSLWYIAIALAIFRDKGHVPVYPRWVAYANGYQLDLQRRAAAAGAEFRCPTCTDIVQAPRAAIDPTATCLTTRHWR
jgi:hypothetical protein